MHELAAAFVPLEEGLAGPNAFGLLLARFGWTVPTTSALGQVTAGLSAVSQALTAVDQAATALQAVLDGDGSADALFGPIQSLATAIGQLTTQVRALEQSPPAGLAAPFDSPDFWQSAPGRPSFWEELLGYLVYARIEAWWRSMACCACSACSRVAGSNPPRPSGCSSTSSRPPEPPRRTGRKPTIAVLVGIRVSGANFDDRLLIQNVDALLRGFDSRRPGRMPSSRRLPIPRHRTARRSRAARAPGLAAIRQQ